MKRLINLPLVGRVLVATDRYGSATEGLAGETGFSTNLTVEVRDKDGNLKRAKDVMRLNWLDKLRFGNSTAIDLGSGLVTTAGVTLLSQDTAVSAGAAALNVFKNVGTGTGTTAAAVGDTALQTAIGTTATAGSNTNAVVSTNATFTNTTTVSYSGTSAVTEWGLFNQTTLSGAKMWDHKVFSAINVVSGDSIQFTYVCTLTAGS